VAGSFEQNIRSSRFIESIYNIAVYLLQARIVEAEKQSLLGNGPYTSSGGTRHVLCDVMHRRGTASGFLCRSSPRSLLCNCVVNTSL
jgi:hypothetical protein